MSVNLELEAGSQFGLEVHSQLPGTSPLLLMSFWVGQELSQKNLGKSEFGELGDLSLPP